jgi:hypothetical protein
LPLHASDDFQKWKGAFRGTFVLQAFATHLSIINGSVRVANLHNKPPANLNAFGALCLAAASVSALYCAHKILLITDRWSGL